MNADFESSPQPPKPLEFDLPFPPSVNRYYRHVGSRTLLSKAGREYRDTVCRLLAGQVAVPLEGPLAAEVRLYPPDRRRRDADNCQKAIWDSVQRAGVYHDDSQIRRLTVELREPDGRPRAEVSLQELPHGTPPVPASRRRRRVPASAGAG